MNLTASYLTGTFEYLEKNLLMVRRQLQVVAQNPPTRRTIKLYGSLPKTNLSFQDFKKFRHQISSSWEQKWS